MKEILIVSSEDTCRSRMAQELLSTFGRGMTLFTAGAMAGNVIPESLLEMMTDQGHEISRKKPMSVDIYANHHWDVILTLCPEAQQEVETLGLKGEHNMHFDFPDPFAQRGKSEEELQETLLQLYQEMHRELFRYYRNVLSDLLMPSCTCGANTYCRCE